MAGQLKIGGNVIATHAGSEGAGTVTLDSSTLTIGSNTTINGSTIGSSTTFPAGHMLQAKKATLGNFIGTTTAVTSTKQGAYDAIGQITITSGNHVLIYAKGTVYADNSTNAASEAEICQGTVASIGTTLTRGISIDYGNNAWMNYELWALDTSPPDTTPDYVFTIRRASSSTNNVQFPYDYDPVSQMLLFEIKG